MNLFDVLALVGLILLATGAALIYFPAGLIVGGAATLAVGVGGQRATHAEADQ